MRHEPEAAQNWNQEPCGSLTQSFISATLIDPVQSCYANLWCYFAPHMGREINYIQWKEQIKPLFFNHPLFASQINIFQCSITSLVESALHLYKYQREVRLMNSSGIDEEAGLREELWVQLGHWQSSRVNQQRGSERRTGCWSLQQPHSAPSDSDVPPLRPVCERVQFTVWFPSLA